MPRQFSTLLFALIFSLPFSLKAQFQPEDVIHTVGQYQLKFKHILAYVDIEMEGEDPALLQDQSYVQALTKECVEEFADSPEEVLADLDQHFQAMEMGMGNLNNNDQGQNQTQDQISGNTNPSEPVSPPASGQWNQLLSGSVLYYTATQSHNGIFIQTTQYMHLCPNGMAYFYQNSGGGGGAITAPGQLEFTGSANWKAIEQGGQAYLQMAMQGTPGNFPMRIINQKVEIQGLGTFAVQRGGAQCR